MRKKKEAKILWQKAHIGMDSKEIVYFPTFNKEGVDLFNKLIQVWEEQEKHY